MTRVMGPGWTIHDARGNAIRLIRHRLALACTALLVYSPLAQRSLILMGAGEIERESQAGAR
jgi:hypothetical protein